MIIDFNPKDYPYEYTSNPSFYTVEIHPGINFFIPKRESDVIDTICVKGGTTEPVVKGGTTDDASISFSIGGIDYEKDEINEFLFFCSPYHEFKIKINSPFTQTLQISYRCCYLDVETRRLFIQNQVNTKGITYISGMAKKNNNFTINNK